MKVGVFLTNQQYLDTDMVVALDEQIKMLHLARDGGWDSIFSGQHYLNEGNNKHLRSPSAAREKDIKHICYAEESGPQHTQ